MSFLKKILKSILSEVKLNTGSPAETPISAPQKTPEPANEASARQEYPYEIQKYPTNDEYFAALINESAFPGYTIERNVHPNVFDASAHPKCYPISYLFKKDSSPVLAILIMNTNQYRAMISKGTYAVLESKGINYIRFFKGMQNEESYVISRIRDNL